MNKKEAIEVINDKLKDIKYYAKEMGEVLKSTNYFIDKLEKEVVKKERSIYGILGWKVGDVYKWKDMKYKLEDGILYVSDLDEECWIESIYNDLFSHKHRVFIIKDEAVKVKEKAYYVKDQYSFNKLMEELEEQGYMWRDGGKLTEEVELCFSNFIFTNSGKFITKNPFLRGVCDFEKEYGNRYELIEYHKEEPLYYAKIKGTQVDIRGVHGLRQKFTIRSWVKLGINNTNVDFERVE